MVDLKDFIKKARKKDKESLPKEKKTLLVDTILKGIPPRDRAREQGVVTTFEKEKMAEEFQEALKDKEKVAEVGEEKVVEQEAGTQTAVSAPTSDATVQKDELMVQIEDILEEGLGDLYEGMPEYLQIEFKKKGEETAFKIRKLLEASKVKVKKILHLILDWLKMIPGVNKFFLEQESKIKTDKIIRLKRNQDL